MLLYGMSLIYGLTGTLDLELIATKLHSPSSLGVTPRYVQRLFESDGTTFSEFLVGQRLARAHRLLCEPNLGHMAISEIAYDAGFGDLSYFNRRFRRLYGLTPRDVRGDGR